MARELATSRDFDVLEIDLHDLSAGGSRHGLNLPTADPNSSARSPSPSIDAPRWIYYSSGTTADPKGARHTDSSIMTSSNALLELMGFREGDVYPIPWPITHIGGASVLATSIRGGVHLILFEAFDPVGDSPPDGRSTGRQCWARPSHSSGRTWTQQHEDNDPFHSFPTCGSEPSVVPLSPAKSTSK